jgi:hypothetical protein
MVVGLRCELAHVREPFVTSSTASGAAVCAIRFRHQRIEGDHRLRRQVHTRGSASKRGTLRREVGRNRWTDGREVHESRIRADPRTAALLRPQDAVSLGADHGHNRSLGVAGGRNDAQHPISNQHPPRLPGIGRATDAYRRARSLDRAYTTHLTRSRGCAPGSGRGSAPRLPCLAAGDGWLRLRGRRTVQASWSRTRRAPGRARALLARS